MIRRSSVIATALVLTLAAMLGPAAAASPKKDKKKSVDVLAAQSLMRQGYVFMQQQRFEEALELFHEADRTNPGNATVFNMIGLCHLSLEQPEKALENFDLALQLIPGFTDARNNRGTTYLSLGQYRMAEVDFIAVLSDSTYPHRWKVFYNLGVTYMRRGQIGAAEENFKKAITAPTPVFEAYLRLAEIAQDQGRTDSALGLLEEASLKFPERLDGMLAYGRLLINVGRPADARPYLEDVIESAPGSELADQARELLGRT
ncbi:MAG: tetratricopeptide repeat protein [Thermoanaerobaculales bacterium]|jgi:Tfp pilus assembly protein PilF|nr:tetratricopeptide repeat protein [Thermoanaerobaculales bacterium]